MDSRRLVALALQVLMVVWTSPAWGQQFPNGTLLLPPQNGPFNPVESLRKGLGINLAALPDDRVFFADVNIGTKCRSDGPITIELPATRYVGSLTSQDFLANASDMVERGLLSPTATLVIAAYDIDSNSGPTLTWDLPRPPEVEIIPPEDDLVTFNGKMPAGGSIFSEPSLLGENEKWSLTAHDVDIQNVKFPEKGANGVEPTPAINTIKIEIDTIGEFHPLFCIGGIDWVALHFKTVSPILLIHGNASNPGFWDRHLFSFELGISSRWPFEGCGGVLCSNPIALETGLVTDNGKTLKDRIPAVVKSLGVNSVHLVAHSKGGLDTREYLAEYQPDFDDEFKVLSFTTLSTPHNGSVGANIQDVIAKTKEKSFFEYPGFPVFTDLVAAAIPANEGTPELTTSATSSFNRRNLPKLAASAKIKYFNLAGADADQDASTSINQLSEWEALRLDDPKLAAQFVLKAQWGLNRIYQLLRTTSNINVEYDFKPVGILGKVVQVVRIIRIEQDPSKPLLNDILVPIRSALGEGSVRNLNLRPGKFVTPVEFVGAEGRNHSSVANRAVAKKVMELVLAAEVLDSRGDIR